MEDYERRVAAAQDAVDLAALECLVVDLAPPARGPGTQALALQPQQLGSVRIVDERGIDEHGGIRAIFGQASRSGSWRVPRTLNVRAVFGAIKLDFRSAEIGRGTSTLRVHVLFGEVIIIVPPGIRVQLEGSGILGEFSGQLDPDEDCAPDAPLLRITGESVLGEVSVQTRQLGESKRDAKRRRKLARKQRKNQLAAAQPGRLGPGR